LAKWHLLPENDDTLKADELLILAMYFSAQFMLLCQMTDLETPISLYRECLTRFYVHDPKQLDTSRDLVNVLIIHFNHLGQCEGSDHHDQRHAGRIDGVDAEPRQYLVNK
jgi:hypothetical protein